MSLFQDFVAEIDERWRTGRSGNAIVVDEIDSTNLLGRRLVENLRAVDESCPEISVFALAQSAGRGRQGRSWTSYAGLGVYATLVRAVSARESQRLPLAVAVGLAGCLRHRYGCPVELKWPNDLLVDGRKLGGILIELLPAEGCTTAIIGFGVNHGHGPDELPTPESTSLRQALVDLPALAGLACDLAEAVDAELAGLASPSALRDRYADLTAHRLGEEMRCRVGGRDVVGIFRGFDSRGFLRIETGGSESILASGEILE